MAATVLVVDDQQTPREVAAEYVEALGFKAIQARNAKEALALLKAEPAKFSAVLTDVDMPPYMHGGELGAEIGKLYPHISVVYTSGKSKTGLVREGYLTAEVPFFEKPLILDEFKRQFPSLAKLPSS